jgi:hypothetical protein
VKSGGPLIVRPTVVVWTSAPLVPVIVTVYVAGGAAAVVRHGERRGASAACGFGREGVRHAADRGRRRQADRAANPFVPAFETV